jgi:hypothetical protein
VLYGCETWKMTQQMKSTLKTWERIILRMIYGPIKYQNGWIIRTNDELQVTYRKSNMITTIKVKSLEGTGCLVRMSEGRT